MFNLVSFITLGGYIGIALMLFAESGLLIGVVLPGDSLLFTAGFLASQGILQIVPLVAIAVVAAVAGDSTGYWLGKKFGPAVFSRKEGFLLHQNNIIRSEHFYAD